MTHHQAYIKFHFDLPQPATALKSSLSVHLHIKLMVTTVSNNRDIMYNHIWEENKLKEKNTGLQQIYILKITNIQKQLEQFQTTLYLIVGNHSNSISSGQLATMKNRLTLITWKNIKQYFGVYIKVQGTSAIA